MAFPLHLANIDSGHFFGRRMGSTGYSRPRAMSFTGRILLGLGLGSLAVAAYAVIGYYRSRTAVRTRTPSRTASIPEAGPYAPREQASMDWILAGRGMDTLVPAAYSIPEPNFAPSYPDQRNPGSFLDSGEAAPAAANVPPVESVFSDPAPGAGSASAPSPLAQPDSGFTSRPGSEPWADTVRRAMEKKPLSFGYDKSVWTAPLLSQYLMETHGVAVPVPQLRQALRRMGYLWKHTHYVQARGGSGRHH